MLSSKVGEGRDPEVRLVSHRRSTSCLHWRVPGFVKNKTLLVSDITSTESSGSWCSLRVDWIPAELRQFHLAVADFLSFTFRLGKTALLPENHDMQVYQLFGLEPFPQSIYIWHPFENTEPPFEETDIKQNNAYNVAIRMCGTRVDAIDQPPSDVFQPGKFISSFGLLWIKIFIQTNMNYLMC